MRDPDRRAALTTSASACMRAAEPKQHPDRTVQDKVASVAKLFHEDIEVGGPYDCGRKVVTKEEIIAFARQFDPQPMHLDEEAAKKTLVGGLCASGFHTCAMMMRMVC